MQAEGLSLVHVRADTYEKERGWPTRGTARDEGTALAAGEHALHVEGDLRAARQWFELAWRQAENDGDRDGMSRSALGLSGIWVHEHRTGEGEATIRARQWAALGAEDPGSGLARRLRIRLARRGGLPPRHP